MSQPVYTSSNGTTVTDVTDQWESAVPGLVVFEIAQNGKKHIVAISDSGSDSRCFRCFIELSTGLLSGFCGTIIASPKPKPKKYRPFVDCFEFLKMTGGRPVWLRHKDELPFQQVIKVDDCEIVTANWTVEFSPVWATFEMSLTPHIADSWVPFGVEEA